MNSTPNYGYETQISAISAIDRDIKRVEDKANASTAAIVESEKQILINKKDIECLSKQKYNGYSKCETDNLLSGKVDKKDGFGLISEDCLHQICTNKGDISLLEGYIKELQEQNACLKEYIDTELSNKVNKTTSIQAHEVELVEGFTHGQGVLRYWKDNGGTVWLSGTIVPSETPSSYEIFGHLPEGFRPPYSMAFPCSASRGSLETAWASYFWVNRDGELYFSGGPIAQNYAINNAICISAAFHSLKAEQ